MSDGAATKTGAVAVQGRERLWAVWESCFKNCWEILSGRFLVQVRTAFVKVLIMWWCFPVKAEIFSQSRIRICGFWGNKGVLSSERGKCSTQRKMSQVELSQTNTGGDTIYGQLTRQQVEGPSFGHLKAVAGGAEEPWFNPGTLGNLYCVVQITLPKWEEDSSSRGGCRDWQSCCVSSRGSALVWGIQFSLQLLAAAVKLWDCSLLLWWMVEWEASVLQN